MQYESMTDARGRTMYYEQRPDGKKYLISQSKIPEGSFIRNLDVEANNPAPPPPDDQDEQEQLGGANECMLKDGAPGVMRRFVNGEIRLLCEEHYQTKTLGELVQFLREETHAH